VDTNCFFGRQEKMTKAQDNASIRTLRRALATLGSEERLAAALEVSLLDLSSWLSGERVAPSPVFIKALDIVAKTRRGAA
jgi:DNA-binding transcriptional regulator YiaG